MSNTISTTPTHSTEPTALDYAVPDPKEAWECFNRLIGKVLDAPKQISAAKDGQSAETSPCQETVNHSSEPE